MELRHSPDSTQRMEPRPVAKVVVADSEESFPFAGQQRLMRPGSVQRAVAAGTCRIVVVAEAAAAANSPADEDGALPALAVVAGRAEVQEEPEPPSKAGAGSRVVAGDTFAVAPYPRLGTPIVAGTALATTGTSAVVEKLDNSVAAVEVLVEAAEWGNSSKEVSHFEDSNSEDNDPGLEAVVESTAVVAVAAVGGIDIQVVGVAELVDSVAPCNSEVAVSYHHPSQLMNFGPSTVVDPVPFWSWDHPLLRPVRKREHLS